VDGDVVHSQQSHGATSTALEGGRTAGLQTVPALDGSLSLWLRSHVFAGLASALDVADGNVPPIGETVATTGRATTGVDNTGGGHTGGANTGGANTVAAGKTSLHGNTATSRALRMQRSDGAGDPLPQ